MYLTPAVSATNIIVFLKESMYNLSDIIMVNLFLFQFFLSTLKYVNFRSNQSDSPTFIILWEFDVAWGLQFLPFEKAVAMDTK